MKKHIFLIILTVLLLVTIMMSFPVSAAKASGTCGDSLTWSFDKSTGTLTISGQGEMKNRNDGLPEWFDLQKDVTRIVIHEGCTSISFSAFSFFRNLTSVSLPTSLTYIGENAFNGCGLLKDISLTYVTFIDKYAFQDCNSLTELTVPNGVTKISYGAFSHCKRLHTVNFHNGVTEIDSYAFSGCTSLTAVTIPDSVTLVGSSSFFRCSNLTEVHLGTGVTELGGNAFQACSNLKSIKIPDKVTQININTFTGCTALETVFIGANVSTVNTSAFNQCPNLKAFTLSSNNKNLIADKGVLYTKNNAELLLMPKGFTGDYTVLSGTQKIGPGACKEATLQSITIPGSVTVIESYAFSNCENLNTVNFSEGLLEIKIRAFISCSSLKRITFPESLTKIGTDAFCRCTSMKEMVFRGFPPQFAEEVFSKVSATAYYPGGISEWKDMIRLEAQITWVPVVCQVHTIVALPAREPTCTESGLSEGSGCSVCKQVFSPQQTLPAKGHTFGFWITNDTSGKEDWIAKRTCSTCNYVEINKLELPTPNNSDQGNTQPDTPETPNQPQPNQPEQIPSDTPVQQLPTGSVPAHDPTEDNTAATEPSETTTNPVTSDPIHPVKDTGSTKWAVVIVVAGVLLLGLGTSGFVFFKRKYPSRTSKKE